MSALSSVHAWSALAIQANLGTRAAAGFLRNRNVSFEQALFILVGRVL